MAAVKRYSIAEDVPSLAAAAASFGARTRFSVPEGKREKRFPHPHPHPAVHVAPARSDKNCAQYAEQQRKGKEDDHTYAAHVRKCVQSLSSRDGSGLDASQVDSVRVGFFADPELSQGHNPAHSESSQSSPAKLLVVTAGDKILAT